MKHALLLPIAVVTVLALTASSAFASCNACNIQTKNPSTKVSGQFDYRISCIDDSSGDEITSNITAPDDDAAMKAGAARCN